MRAAYPPGENINGRFARTDRMLVQRADVISVDQASGRATVAIDLQEVLDSGVTRHWSGTWGLVRGTSGWLLDQPNLGGG